MSSENNKMGSAITHQINIYRGAPLCQKLEIPWVSTKRGWFPSHSILGAVSVRRGRNRPQANDHTNTRAIPTATHARNVFTGQACHSVIFSRQEACKDSPEESSLQPKDDVVAGQQKLLRLFPCFHKVMQQLLPSEVSISHPSPSELTLGLTLVNRL